MKDNLEENKVDFTASEDEIRFDASKEQEQKTEDNVKDIKTPKKAKWYFIIPVVFLVIFAIIFVVWHLVPKKILNVCVLDKTILTVNEENNINPESVYRKHQGLFWLLEQQRYVFEDGSFYDYKTDYFGPMLNENNQIDTERSLSTLNYTPDLMYVSDVYGAVDDSFGYYNNSDALHSGITVDDMSAISYAYEIGSTVVAEMELFNSNLDNSVYSQLQSMCGVNPTGWVGRYIQELQDFTDVPDWAPPMYEKQEGVEWQFSGPGILLVSSEKIIILEQKTDFESKNLLTVHINSEYEKEFRACSTVNFYNWFEIVEPYYDSESIATFEFDVNATGMEKLKGILKSPKFAAVTRKTAEGKGPVYYFAADFNDYVSHQNYNRFLFANYIYRLISYDRQGDISNFYWNFYNPLMTKILSDIETSEYVDNTHESGTDIRINDNHFQIYSDDTWNDIILNAVSINATEPGETGYSRNYAFYETLVEEMIKAGANCIYAKDILPPEFYRAVYSNNLHSDSSDIYIIQTLTEPEEATDTAWKNKIESLINALHGNGSVQLNSTSDNISYFIDVSDYTLALVIDHSDAINDYTYSGKYASGDKSLGFTAYLYDTVQNFSMDNYEKLIPVGFTSNVTDIISSDAGSKSGVSSVITDETCLNNYSFDAVSFNDVEKYISSNQNSLKDVKDKYGYVFDALSNNVNKKLMISGIGYSSACGMYGTKAITEKSQGQKTVSVLESADKAGVLCAVAADLNDDWSAVSDEMYPFTAPIKNNYLWHNVADPAQTTGFIALDAAEPEEVGINLTDDDRVQMMSLSSNESYLYVTVQLLEEIDYTEEQLFIGIDTYQRNDGEYYYSDQYTPTSLSGMEFVLRFDSKQSAGLYVIPSYNRSKNSYVTKESYSGKYDLVSNLSYGGFSSGDYQFYQTGLTIYIRLPWSWLNVADPSNRIVINNDGSISGQCKTVTTNGIIMSVLIVEKLTKDQLYLFPETKGDPSYKTFDWSSWENVSYTFREKDSFTQLKKYFTSKLN